MVNQTLYRYIDYNNDASMRTARAISRLANLKTNLEAIGRDWERDILNPAIFNIIPLKSYCTGECLINSGQLVSCKLDELRSQVEIEFTINLMRKKPGDCESPAL